MPVSADEAEVVDAFHPALPRLSASLAGESFTLTRATIDPGPAPLCIHAPAEDAFALVIQIAPSPAHRIRCDAQFRFVEAGPRHSAGLFDLASAIEARIEGKIDSLHFKMPRNALDIFCDRSGRARVARMRQAGRPFSEVDPIASAIAQALETVLQAPSRNLLLAEHLLLSLAAHAIASFGEQISQRVKTGGLSHWQERRAKAMLEPGTGPVTLSDVADACGVSTAHFSRSFRMSVGHSPWAWRQGRQVETARTLLRNPNLSLAEVALAVGFADQSHFTRLFARHSGTTPGRWRRERGVIGE